MSKYIIQFKRKNALISNYINTSENWKNEELCGRTMLRSDNFEFFQFTCTSVDITVYQYENMLYIFYNIARKT